MERKKRKEITEEIITKICKLYQDGMSSIKIAETLDVSQGTVNKYLRLNNINTSYIKLDIGQEIIKKYLNGATINSLHDEYGFKSTTISKYLKNNNIEIRSPFKFDLIKKEQICKDYINGMTEEKLAEKYDSNRTTIRNVLKEFNIKIRDNSEYRIYSLNENYFDKIDTPNKAYILGLLYADGNVSKEKYRIQLSLQEGDVKILEDIRQEIQSEAPLEFRNFSKYNKKYDKNVQDQWSLSVNSKHMHESLCNLGIIPNKSLIITYPDFLSNELQRHFLRGALDGDGCINKPYGENGKLRIAYICGTPMFCSGVKEVVEKELGVHVSLIQNNKIQKATISGRLQVKKFLDWLYEDANLKLDRKYQLYLKYYCNNEQIA